MSWSLAAQWPPSGEIIAEHFEDIRKWFWALWYAKKVHGGAAWTTPPTWDKDTKYSIGANCIYNGEIYLCVIDQWLDPVEPPKSEGWKLGTDISKYSHFAMYANRYIYVNGYIIFASELLPVHVDPRKQWHGPLKWIWPKVFFKGDTAEFGNGIFKQCTKEHLSTVSGDDANWVKITEAQARKPIEHPRLVEFDFRHITGVIGAIYPYPAYQGHEPPPWFYNYHMYPHNDPVGDYYNPKHAMAYQAYAELIINSWGGAWYGPPYGAESPNDWCGHTLGTGTDPEVEPDKMCWPFNRSAFEEVLFLAGNYDWYLDLNFPPDFGPQNAAYGCWRRTWSSAQDWPAGVGQQRRNFYISFTANPEHSSEFYIGRYAIQFSDTASDVEYGPNYIRVPIGWDLAYTIQTFTDAINFAGNNGLAINANVSILSETQIHITMAYEAGTIEKILPQTHMKIDETVITGGYTLMWPREWGKPPQPTTSWLEFTEVLALYNELQARWEAAGEEFKNEFIERHTANFRPWQSFYHPELAADIPNNIKALMPFLKYRLISPGVYHKWINFVPPQDDEPQLFDTMEAAVAALKEGGDWQEADSWGGDGYGVGFQGGVAAGPWYNPTDGFYYLKASFSVQDWLSGKYSRDITGAGIKLRAVSNQLYAIYGQVDVIVKIILSAPVYIGNNPYDVWKASDGSIYRHTVRHSVTSICGGSIKANAELDERAIVYVTIPLTPTASEEGVVFLPEPKPEFYPHNYDLTQLPYDQTFSETGRGLIALTPYSTNAMLVNDPFTLNLE